MKRRAEPTTPRPVSPPAAIGLGFAIAAMIGAIAGALGPRLGWWDFDVAVLVVRWSAYAGVPAAVLCLLGMLHARRGRRGMGHAALGLILLIAMLALPVYWRFVERDLPPIHDITTDTLEPPDFWVAPNSRMYGGAAIAAMQRRAYPDIAPLVLAVPVGEAFDQALRVVRENGWEVLDAERDEGRIEATDTTFWFGFKDDIVVRVSANVAGSRVDVRSASRFGGGGDGGANANRIRAFLGAIEERLRGARE